jgi:hypothetical protein
VTANPCACTSDLEPDENNDKGGGDGDKDVEEMDEAEDGLGGGVCPPVAYHEKKRWIALFASAAVANEAKYNMGSCFLSLASAAFFFLIGSVGGSPDSWRKRQRSLFSRSTVSAIDKH